jgi:hypothetical protein
MDMPVLELLNIFDQNDKVVDQNIGERSQFIKTGKFNGLLASKLDTEGMRSSP